MAEDNQFDMFKQEWIGVGGCTGPEAIDRALNNAYKMGLEQAAKIAEQYLAEQVAAAIRSRAERIKEKPWQHS